MKEMCSKKMEKGSIVIPIVVVILIVLVVAGYFIFTKFLVSNTQSAQATSYVKPTMPITDFAPNLPMSRKTKLIIRDADSSTMEYIVPTDQVNTYIKQLPAGDSVVSKSQ